MKKLVTLFAFAFYAFTSVSAQDMDDRSTFLLQLNQDHTFGFYPIISGSLPIEENIDFTAYTILWTNPYYADASAGSGFLLEFGVGMGFTKGNWYINPSVGFTNGMFTQIEKPQFGEGIAPSILVLFKNDKFELETFAEYYQGLRKSPSNYLLAWVMPGYRFSRTISAGLHLEQFTNTNAESDGNVYARVGAYTKFTFRKKYELRFSGGYTPNLYNGENSTFYKLTANIPF